MYICVDFDGTVVTHDYPKVGQSIGAESVLKALVSLGHNIILFTMRSGKELDDAVEWFEKNNIPLYGVNKNPTQKQWTTSPKVYAQLYIDDAALGCPLHSIVKIENITIEHERPFVNWKKVKEILIDKGIVPLSLF